MRVPLRALAWLLAPLLTVALSAAPAAAQPRLLQEKLAQGGEAQEAAAPAAGETAADAAAIEKRRDEVAAERAALEAQLAPGEAATDRRLVALERLERFYTRQLDALKRAESQAEQLAELQRRIEAGPQAALGADPPYGLDRLDQLLDAQDAAREQQPILEAAVAAAQSSLEEARRALEEREAARRAAKEAAASAQGEAAVAEAQRQLRFAELVSEIGRARVRAEELALRNAQTDREIQRQTEVALAAQIEYVEQNLALDEDELAQRLAAIERREFALRDEKAAAEQALRTAERRLTAVQKRADAEAQPGPGLAAELEARRFGLLEAQRRTSRIDQEIERLTDLRRMLQARARLLGGEASREERRVWERELPRLQTERERDRRLTEARIGELERLRALLQGRLPAGAPGDAAPTEEQRWLAEQLAQVERALADERQRLSGLDENTRIAGRLARALGLREQRATLADRAADAADALGAVWSKELVAVEDSPITIGKIATAILLFALGVLVSRVLARTLGALVRRRSALDEGAVNAIQSLAFYALLALFFLLALNSVNIPLTAFTVAGGAIAIGIGFGSQAVVNNFVSGLILMIERPIKVGDLVVYADTSGRVERIGPRSTRIRTFDNVHLIVPNSKVIDNNIVNWTLGDDLMRTRVTVSVVYGTPTREVEKALLELMAAQPEILKHPRPAVLFEEFAPDGLRFHADFWLKLSPLLDDRVVRSELRHAIDQEFRRRGLVLSYPPRDESRHVPRRAPPEAQA